MSNASSVHVSQSDTTFFVAKMVEKSSARCAQFSAPHIDKLPRKAQASVDKSFRQQRCQPANRLSRCAFECDCRQLASCSRLPTQAPTDDKIVPLSDMPVANSRRSIASLMSLICHTIGGAIAIIFLLTLPLSMFPEYQPSRFVASAPYTEMTQAMRSLQVSQLLLLRVSSLALFFFRCLSYACPFAG